MFGLRVMLIMNLSGHSWIINKILKVRKCLKQISLFSYQIRFISLIFIENKTLFSGPKSVQEKNQVGAGLSKFQILEA